MLRFLTAGESHGTCLVVIVDGLPAGLEVPEEAVNDELRRRQRGYGRGPRMAVEEDRARFLAGVSNGRTTGAPVAMMIPNRAGADRGADDGRERGRVSIPRPGHADYAGSLKYGLADMTDVIERASARETAARVAAGALARILLSRYGVSIESRIVRIGRLEWDAAHAPTPDDDLPEEARLTIDRAREQGDSLGGAVEVEARGVPPGLGSYAQWDRRLDASIAATVMSIPSVKGVEFGLGFAGACLPGSLVHDPFVEVPGSGGGAPGWTRGSNNAGGLEGGMTNGQPVVVRLAAKPIPTLARGLASVDMATAREVRARYERSDVCALPAVAVVAENVVAFCLAQAFLDKFSGDSLADVDASYRSYAERIRDWWSPGQTPGPRPQGGPRPCET